MGTPLGNSSQSSIKMERGVKEWILRNFLYARPIIYALPARPTWIISVVLSSLLSTGQLLPSILTKESSNLVPKILYADFTGSICAYSGILALYLVESAVGRSRATEDEENSTSACSLIIFFKNILAITLVDV